MNSLLLIHVWIKVLFDMHFDLYVLYIIHIHILVPIFLVQMIYGSS